jgi:hypothetical protein
MVLSTIIMAGFSFGNLLRAADQADIFYYVLPFLLIFALIYGILSKSEVIGKNKGVNVIIALSLGLLSLVGNYFPDFIQKMGGKLAIGLSLVLAIMILLGLFMDAEHKWITNLFVIVGIVAFVIVAYSSLADYSFSGSFLWNDYAPAIISLVVIGFIVWFAVKD